MKCGWCGFGASVCHNHQQIAQVTVVGHASVCVSVCVPLQPNGHCIYRTVVTVCTAQWSLYIPHSGHYFYRQFNIQQLFVLPTQCIYVFCVDLRTNSDYFPIQH